MRFRDFAAISVYVAVLILGGFMAGWGARGLADSQASQARTEAVNLPLAPGSAPQKRPENPFRF